VLECIVVSHHNKSLTPEQIDDLINSGKDPVNTPGANFGILESLTNSDVQKFDISSEVQSITGTTQNPASVAVEDFSGVSFENMLNDFQPASGTLDNGNGGAWQQIAASIIDASDTFQESLAAQEAQKDWVGKTHDAAIANITQSLPDLATTAEGANALGLLINAFARTIFQTQWYFLSNAQAYGSSLSLWPNETDLINQAYNSYAQDVMNTVYAPNITSIASNNPGFGSSSQNNPSPPPADPNPNPPPPPADPNPTNLNPPPPLADPNPNPPPPPADPNPTNLNPPPPPANFNTPASLLGSNSGINTNGSPFTPPPNSLANLPNSGGVTNPLTGSANPLGGSGSLGAGSSDFALPNTAGITNPLTGSGSLGAGSSDFALPNTAGITNPLGGSGSLGAGSSDFALPNTAGITNPLGGSGGPSTGASDFALPNSAGIINPLGSTANSSSGSGNPLGGSGNPLGGSGNPLGGSGNPLGGAPGSPATGSGASGLTSALGQAADGLEQPLQQALGAAQNHPGGASGGGGPDLGPKGLDALANSGAGPGHAGGGGGAGIGSQGHATLSPPGAPVAAVGKGTDVPGSALARPGAPVGAGGSPGGAPPGGGGGGQRGSTSKEHKASKALRRKKNGELVIGEADAVVPVIGDDGQEDAEPPQHAPAPPAPQVPRPAAVGNPRRAAFEQRAEFGR
jgi:hypothetical protein